MLESRDVNTKIMRERHGGEKVFGKERDSGNNREEWRNEQVGEHF
jgi:hypothetical protein